MASRRGGWPRRRVAACVAALCLLVSLAWVPDRAMASGAQTFAGRLQVERMAPDDPRVRVIVLVAEDGRRYILDPSENGRAPAEMHGAIVEIQGELLQGYGGGSFLHLRSLKKIR